MKPEQEPKYKAVPVPDGNGVSARIMNRASKRIIPDDEPIFILRGQDVYASGIIDEYADRLKDGEHREVVLKRARDFRRFANEHPDRMKEPDTKRSDLEA